MQLNFCQALLPALTTPPAPAGAPELVCWPGDAAPQRLTAADLRAQLVAAQASLVGQGVGPGQSVLVLLPLTSALLVALLALLGLGAVPVLPPAGATAAGLGRLMRGAGGDPPRG
ncbi:AMP-binding protein [uncultured Hymenobacter sp.]|uniref:AMP-binding protein n=1 Tax=uncultured Hymenobacter sp. TaxID=170016 RepID=UPI0035CA9FA6